MPPMLGKRFQGLRVARADVLNQGNSGLEVRSLRSPHKGRGDFLHWNEIPPLLTGCHGKIPPAERGCLERWPKIVRVLAFAEDVKRPKHNQFKLLLGCQSQCGNRGSRLRRTV